MRTPLLLALALTGCVRGGYATPPGAADSAVDAAGRSGEPRALELGSPWSGFSIGAFKALWSTPQAVTWIWQCAGPVPDFDRLELCFSRDLARLLAGQGTCLGPLDGFGLGHLECKGDPWWAMTTTYSLDPVRTYHAQLLVRGTAGGVARSTPASKSTPPVPTSKLVIFADTVPAGVTLGGLTLSSAHPAAGSQGLTAVLSDGLWRELRLDGVKLDLPGLTAARLDASYLELFLDVPQAVGVAVYMDGPTGTFTYNLPAGYLSPDARPGYQRLQVPLRQLLVVGSAQSISAAQLQGVTKLWIAALWGPGTVFLDEIAIYY